jgi:hypothetical protein
MRRSSQFLVGGFVMIAVGLGFYVALVLLQATGNQVPLTLGPLSLFVLVAGFFFRPCMEYEKE